MEDADKNFFLSNPSVLTGPVRAQKSIPGIKGPYKHV